MFVTIFFIFFMLLLGYIPWQIFWNDYTQNLRRWTKKVSLLMIFSLLWSLLCFITFITFNPFISKIDPFVEKVVGSMTFGLINPFWLLGAIGIIFIVVTLTKAFNVIKVWHTKKREFEKNQAALQKVRDTNKKLTEQNIQIPVSEKPETDEIDKKDILDWQYVQLDKQPNWKSGKVLHDTGTSLSDHQMALWHDKKLHFTMMRLPAGELTYDNERKRVGEVANADRRKLRSFTQPLAMADTNFDNSRAGGNGFDRTHLFPIGIIGTEVDERVIIWFDRFLNQGVMKDWETIAKLKVIGSGGVWLTVLEHLPDGRVAWHYRLYDYDVTELVTKLDVVSRTKYIWKEDL